MSELRTSNQRLHGARNHPSECECSACKVSHDPRDTPTPYEREAIESGQHFGGYDGGSAVETNCQHPKPPMSICGRHLECPDCGAVIVRSAVKASARQMLSHAEAILRIEQCVREIQIVSDAHGLDPAEWLADGIEDDMPFPVSGDQS